MENRICSEMPTFDALPSSTPLPSVFDFNSASSYIRAVSEEVLHRGRRKMPLHRWAKKLGFRSPRSIAMVLKGQRRPSLRMLHALATELHLPQLELQFLSFLAEREGRNQVAPAPEVLSGVLGRLVGNRLPRLPIDLKRFACVAEWHHVVIRQLVDTLSFRADENWISQRLRGKVKPREVKSSLQVLLEVGLIRRVRDDEPVYETTKGCLKTGSDIPSAALRAHHKGMLGRAAEALEEQTAGEREIAAATFLCDRSRILQAKKRIRDFLQSMEDEFRSSDSTSVFQLNVQFFEHTTQVRES